MGIAQINNNEIKILPAEDFYNTVMEQFGLNGISMEQFTDIEKKVLELKNPLISMEFAKIKLADKNAHEDIMVQYGTIGEMISYIQKIEDCNIKKFGKKVSEVNNQYYQYIFCVSAIKNIKNAIAKKKPTDYIEKITPEFNKHIKAFLDDKPTPADICKFAQYLVDFTDISQLENKILASRKPKLSLLWAKNFQDKTNVNIDAHEKIVAEKGTLWDCVEFARSVKTAKKLLLAKKIAESEQIKQNLEFLTIFPNSPYYEKHREIVLRKGDESQIELFLKLEKNRNNIEKKEDFNKKSIALEK